MAVSRADVADFAAVPGVGLDNSEHLEGLKGVSGNFGSVEKERFDLL